MLNSPNVWLWIVSSQFDLDTAKRFVALLLKDFEMKISMYYPSKVERLDNSSNQAVAAVVRLIFLLKKDEEGELKHLGVLKKSYSMEEIPYYREFQKNTEAKYRIHPSELRMGFYINLLESFFVLGENVIGVYMGSKFMIATKVSFHSLCELSLS